jgi:aconitase A
MRWQKAWNKSPYDNEPDKKSRLHKLEIDIERNELARKHLEEQVENLAIKTTALEHHAEIQNRNEKRKQKRGYTDRVRQGVGRPPKEKKSSLYKDYNRHRSLLEPPFKSETAKKREALGMLLSSSCPVLTLR